LGVGQFFPFALDLFAPIEDFLIFSVYLIAVNGVHNQLRTLPFQLFNHCVGGVKQVQNAHAGCAA